MKNTINIFWFRRDLRLDDNAGLYHALKSNYPVLCIFIFDPAILDNLEDKDDARVNFIYDTIIHLQQELEKDHSSLLVLYDKVDDAWQKLIEDYNINTVYTNHDYEPYAKARDQNIEQLLNQHNISLNTYKDQVIFEKNEVTKDDDKPYTVFTPYKRKWLEKLKPFYLKAYPDARYFKNFYQTAHLSVPTLKEIGFEKSGREIPPKTYKNVIDDYAAKRDYPAIKGTSHIGIHLRFGTVTIRQL